MSGRPPYRIDLKTRDNWVAEEAQAADANTKPGYLMQYDANGKVLRHAVSGGPHEHLIALGDHLQGKTIADAYAADDIVFLWFALPGDVALMVLKTGQNVAKSAYLASNGDGTLKAAATGNVRVCRTLEAVNAVGVDSFIRVCIVPAATTP